MKKSLVVGCAFVFVFACAAFAQYDADDGYVVMERSDTAGYNYSWNGYSYGWSDGQPPHSNTNYFIPAGKRMAQPHRNGGKWEGGKIVVSGYIWTRHTGSSLSYLPQFDDIVFLGGSYVYSNWDVGGLNKSKVTVEAPADNPFELRTEAGSNSYVGTGYLAETVFSGEASTGVRLRVLDDSSKPTSTIWIDACCFSGYPGTVGISGSKTIVAPRSGGGGFAFAGTLAVTNGATLCGAASSGDWTAYPSMPVGTFILKDGGRYEMYLKNGVAHPLIEATEGFSIEDDANVKIDNFLAGLAGSTDPESSESRIVIAHLTGAAVENCTVPEGEVPVGALSDLVNAESVSIFNGWKYEIADDGNGGKNVCLVRQGHLAATLTNDSRPNSDSSLITNTAFYASVPAKFWSDGVVHTNAAEEVDLLLRYNWYPYVAIDVPYASVTYNKGTPDFNGCYVGNSRTFRIRELNWLDVGSFGIWSGSGSPSKITTITGGKMNLVGSSKMAILASHSYGFNVLSDITGTKTLHIHDRDVSAVKDRQGNISLSGDNSAFHGRLIIENHCSLDGDLGNLKCFITRLGDARNWGGAFTQDDETFSAITLRGWPLVYVTNDVTFAETGREMLVTNGVRFSVSAGRTFALDNHLTCYGPVVKMGAGTLELGGRLDLIPSADASVRTNLLDVTAGTLKVSSKTAVDGFDVSFAAGTRIVVGRDCGFVNVKSDNPLTIADAKLPVEIAGFDEKPEDDVEVAVLTLNKTAAANIGTDRFELTGTKSCKILKFEKREVGDNVEYVATVSGKKGVILIVR